MFQIILWFLLVPLAIILILGNLWIVGIIAGILAALYGGFNTWASISGIKKHRKEGEKTEKWEYVLLVGEIIFTILGLALFVWGIVAAH